MAELSPVFGVDRFFFSPASNLVCCEILTGEELVVTVQIAHEGALLQCSVSRAKNVDKMSNHQGEAQSGVKAGELKGAT